MKKQLVLLSLFWCSTSFGQDNFMKYLALIQKADSLYNVRDYRNSAYTYSAAFKENGWKGRIDDRYNAACSWALANIPDSSFFYLQKAILQGGYMNYSHISIDPDLISLHTDSRWKILLEKVKENKENAEAKLNKPLVSLLDTIYRDDQENRMRLTEVATKYGWESQEIQALWSTIAKKDSINLIKVTTILDNHGWVGPEEVGQQGNTTLFLVIQHADQKTQEKYLPLMKEAVKNKKAHAGNLALLEDRILLEQGKKQIYGSQIGRDSKANKHYVLPLHDPDNVDKRRAAVGLQPLAAYLSQWNILWDVEQYKKDLPAIEAELKRTNR